MTISDLILHEFKQCKNDDDFMDTLQYFVSCDETATDKLLKGWNKLSKTERFNLIQKATYVYTNQQLVMKIEVNAELEKRQAK